MKKSHFVYLIEHFFLWVPKDPFHAVKLQKYFMHISVKGWSWLKFNNLGMALGIALKFYNSVVKGL